MNKLQETALKDLVGFYRGIVVNNVDPDSRGQVQVNVYGVFDGLATADLPWAKPAMPIGRGAGAGYGYFAVPEIGTHIWCFFEEGDLYQPVFFAEASDGTHGLPTERTTNYPGRVVWKTKAGIVIYIDDTDKELKITHPEGTTLVIDGSGNVTLTSVGNIIITGTTVAINPA